MALQNRTAMWGRSIVSNCYSDGGNITSDGADSARLAAEAEVLLIGRHARLLRDLLLELEHGGRGRDDDGAARARVEHEELHGLGGARAGDQTLKVTP